MNHNLLRHIALGSLLLLFSIYGSGVDHYFFDMETVMIECSAESEVEIEEEELTIEKSFSFNSLEQEIRVTLNSYRFAFSAAGIVQEAPSTPPPEC